MAAKNSEIKLSIELDKNNVPEKLNGRQKVVKLRD